ncbi:hypothetical protein COY16_05475 [Candidatus Roizmanbacteria bacterium CG_4_10_14_0_2_um_filter_39_13]|uniref:Radical SAM core domain-containing protein n=1 Tax=Candidatus Roizmanbacteria bacterium CG_4_10_14_0_2_um_filter_39_13 TaxID=1974825 RepID=A0A2M7TW52_9BACT|nr:MAG: hypothetical protein COY16_05475 [Candidatus Roizmanbacteria bacterium CG_4_10_14_0_2_um_filter_39_13]
MSDSDQKQRRISTLLHKKEILLDALKNKVDHWQNNRIKMHVKSLSPACRSCYRGSSIDININHICSRKCFYCPVPVLHNWKPYVALEGVKVDKIENLVDLLRKFNIKVVSFSGGDPLLTFDLLEKYIRAIRQEFHSSIYTMVYTNADLLTEKRAQFFGEIGLDEIRINLSGRNFDMMPLKLAKKYIKRVTISSPVVPEEKEKMIDAFKEIDELGIDHINLIELMAAEYNLKNLKERKYIMKNNTAILDSEVTFYEILHHALKKKTKTPIHFCTADYKAKSSRQTRNLRYSRYAQGANESITPIGKIRQIFRRIETGRKVVIPAKKFSVNTDEQIYLQYYNTYVKEVPKTHKGKKIEINKDFYLATQKKPSKKMVLQGTLMLLLFQLLFIENKPVGEIVSHILIKYRHLVQDEKDLFENLITFYNQFDDEEYFGEPQLFSKQN